MLHVIDLMGVAASNMTFVIKEHLTGKICWSGTLPEFVREMSSFFMYYMAEVEKIDTDSIKGQRLLVIYI